MQELEQQVPNDDDWSEWLVCRIGIRATHSIAGVTSGHRRFGAAGRACLFANFTALPHGLARPYRNQPQWRRLCPRVSRN